MAVEYWNHITVVRFAFLTCIFIISCCVVNYRRLRYILTTAGTLQAFIAFGQLLKVVPTRHTLFPVTGFMENPGQMVYFVGTHYDHYSSRAKTGSSNLIISRIREIAGITDIKNADVAVFVAGDFNTEYDAVELAAMRNAMYDARTTSPKTSTTQVTFNNFGGDGQMIIDHIFYGGNIEAEAYEVITGSYGVPYISDHYPVLFRCSYK